MESWLVQRGREGREAARPLSAERRDQEALRSELEEVALSAASTSGPATGRRCSSFCPRSSASSRCRRICHARSSALAGMLLMRDAVSRAPARGSWSAQLRAARGRRHVAARQRADACRWRSRFPQWDADARRAGRHRRARRRDLAATCRARTAIASQRSRRAHDRGRQSWRGDYPNARIVFTGGNGRCSARRRRRPIIVRRLLESFGIARERVVLEDRARATPPRTPSSRKALVQPKPGERWLLVTSAHHMPRSVGVFRQAGFPVEAYPVDWRTDVAYRFAPSRSASLRRTWRGPTRRCTNGSACWSIG